MSNVVIVDAVRSADRASQRRPVHRASRRPPVDRPGPSSAQRDRPHRDRPDRRWLRQPGRRAVVQHDAHRLLPPACPRTIAATTVDTQCGSSQQAINVATALVGSGVTDVADRLRGRVDEPHPDRQNSAKKLGLGVPIPKPYFGRYEFTSQFEGAERIADKWGIVRAERRDEFGLASQERAATGRGPRTASPARSSRSTPPTSTTTASRPAPPTGSSATRDSATPASRRSPS